MLYPCKASSQTMTQNSSAEETSRDPALRLRLASTIEFDSACLSVFFAHGWYCYCHKQCSIQSSSFDACPICTLGVVRISSLVCGLGSGIVKVYERDSGHEITLTVSLFEHR